MWTAIDNYCERTDASFLSEPLNLFSNAAFFVAAFLASRGLAEVAPQKQRPLKIMLALCVLVGLGSSLFHSFAVRWAELADVVPIGLFILFYIGLFFRVLLERSWAQVGLAYAGFIVLTLVFSLAVDPQLVNRSQNYFGTLVFLFVLYYFAWKARIPEARHYLLAGFVFILSITARALDMEVCDAFPLGTHFLWHTGNGVALYLVMRAAISEAARMK